MKLVTYSLDGAISIGITDGQGVANLTERLSLRPRTMIDLIENWEPLRQEVVEISAFPQPLAEVRLLAPIPRPG